MFPLLFYCSVPYWPCLCFFPLLKINMIRSAINRLVCCSLGGSVSNECTGRLQEDIREQLLRYDSFYIHSKLKFLALCLYVSKVATIGQCLFTIHLAQNLLVSIAYIFVLLQFVL